MKRLKQLLPTPLCAAALLVALSAGDAAAQCAMCKTSASSLEAGGIKHLNFAVLLLLVPPVSMFCGFFFAAYKRRGSPEDQREAGGRATRADAHRTGDTETIRRHDS
jgi:hypothetical protein